MFWNACNGTVEAGGAVTDYIRFGRGTEDLIILPGVGDGFRTARGLAVPFALLYRKFARRYRVWVFSRRRDLPEGFTTRDMAEDLSRAMAALGIERAAVLGVSQGGMIAQQLALRHPEQTARLVLAVTASRPNDLLRECVGRWLAMADRDDYRGIMVDTAERSYTGAYRDRNRRLYRLLGGVGKPKDYTRFRVLCRSCLEHDVYGELDAIRVPTAVIAASEDGILGLAASEEMAARIPGSKLFVYEGYSHGVYDQAKDFNDRVLRCLQE